MEAAGAGVRDVGFDGTQLHVFHKSLSSFSAALETEGDNTAGATRHILLGKGIVRIRLQTAVLDPSDLFVALQELGDSLGIGAVLLHAEGQAFQAKIQIKCALGGLNGAQVAHQLGGTFGNKCAGKAKPLRVGDTMVAVIGGAQAGKFLGILSPVELAAVYDAAATATP